MTKRAQSPKTCACGCGREFIPARSWQRFIDDKHRWNHWYRNRREGTRLDKARKILDRQDLPLDQRLKKVKRLLSRGRAMQQPTST